MERKTRVDMTWDELQELVKEYPNIRLIYKGKNRVSVEFVTDEGLVPQPPDLLPDGTVYDFDGGM